MSDNEYLCTDTIKMRRIKPQNVVCRLIARQCGFQRPGTHSHAIREFYQCIYPNMTVVNVEKPGGYLRKFSPDGKYLIAFTLDQTSLEIYTFRGVSAAAKLIHSWRMEVVPNENNGKAYDIRSKIFKKLFRPKHVVNVTCSSKQLNRECSLFTNNGRYVIVGSASFVQEGQRPSFYTLYQSNESLTPTDRSPIEDYTIYLVDLHNGLVSDKLDFNLDKIYLSHNQGLYLYNDTLAILSVQHQTIHIFQLMDGTFNYTLKIGRFCNMDDMNLYELTIQETIAAVGLISGRTITSTNRHEATIGSLKHRFLVYLFWKAKRKSEEDGNPSELRKFYQYFDQYRALRMWKMQLLDENHVLIKYAHEDVVTLKSSEPHSQPLFFVIYQIWTYEIVAVFNNTSQDLLHLFENFSDSFRNVCTYSEVHQPCAPNNNIYAKLLQTRFKQQIISARGGGQIEATKRILAQLPISAQSYTCSPYLDLSLFSYDEKWVSAMERPKGFCEYPIRFFARDSGLMKFRIFPGLQDKTIPMSMRRLVAYTFHPTEPFAISVQRIESQYVVNFHIRNTFSKMEV